MSKEYIVQEILNIPDKKLIAVDIAALTAAKSGELTTVVYECKELGKRGLIFVFWSDRINEMNIKYRGYAFSNFEFENAKQLLTDLEKALEEKDAILKQDKDAVFKFGNTHFLFSKDEMNISLIRVMWNGFDSEWNQTNLKTLKKRFDKFFVPK